MIFIVTPVAFVISREMGLSCVPAADIDGNQMEIVVGVGAVCCVAAAWLAASGLAASVDAAWLAAAVASDAAGLAACVAAAAGLGVVLLDAEPHPARPVIIVNDIIPAKHLVTTEPRITFFILNASYLIE